MPRKKKNTVKDIAIINKKVKGVSKIGRKYPRYFYENAPIWVESLEKANLKNKPSGTGANAKYCGNCTNLSERGGVYSGEPYCSANEAAVRGQWVCDKWRKGTNQNISIRKLGVEI